MEPAPQPPQPPQPPPASPEAASASASSWLPGPLSSAYEEFYDNVIRPYADPSRDKLLPDHPQALKGREKPTLVVSLDGTLIESQWTRQFGWRYAKRPGVDEFIEALAPFYELVLWTDCMTSADTVINRLDARRRFSHRLYRDATTYTEGEHRKDLSHLNRNMDRVLIVDCASYGFGMQPRHGIALKPYCAAEDVNKDDKSLHSLVPFLIYLALAARKGTLSGSFADELQLLNVSTTIEDGGAAFKEAVNNRFAELRAQNKLPAQRSRAGGGSSSPGGTLWERMKLVRGG
uniref:Mitochondrial import inner membrane translocase subunit TIM50 n=2 Tax=Haptolina brevifila TaxID=156173 RepID=A0A7S2GM10_9EUKA